jgi:cell division protease FtsH
MPERKDRSNTPLGSTDQQRQGSPTRLWLWILLAWVVGYFVYSWFVSPNQADVAYSNFKQLVRQGNVAEVTVQNKTITGEFADGYTHEVVRNGDTATYSQFSTVNPGYENKELMELLEANGVSVSAEAESRGWWMFLPLILIFALPWLLFLGYGMLLRKKMQQRGGGSPGGGGMGGAGGLFGVGKSRAKRYSKSEKTSTRFDEVAGLANAKRDLQEIVQYLREPGKFTALGAQIPKGVLLMGPPGTGKTLLARASAGEAGVPFFSISGSEFIEMFVGVGASRVRDMFANAKKEAPAIIFIDELDSVGRSRGAGVGGGHDEREQTLNQILAEMDGFEPTESVVVMAATNRPDVLDPALTRPGRFDRQITLELPPKDARLDILKIHTRKVPLEDEVDLENIAARTVTFSGADLKNLVNESALLAGRKNKGAVGNDDFDEAADKIMLGDKRERQINDQEKRVIAYHEAGHALVAKLLPNTDPLQKVTIVARGRTLGATQQIPEMDRTNLDREYLLSRIAVSLGGRSAEKLVFNTMTNGAAHDLKSVTGIAKKMVCQWGMSERLGEITYNQGEEHVFLGREMAQQKDFSESTAQLIDEEIRKIVSDMGNRAMEILEKNRESLDAVVDGLLEHETLENHEIDKILGDNGGKAEKKQEEEPEQVGASSR